MIGYEIGSSPAGAKTSLAQHGGENDLNANMATLLARGFCGSQVSRATSNPRTRNLTSRELQLEAL